MLLSARPWSPSPASCDLRAGPRGGLRAGGRRSLMWLMCRRLPSITLGLLAPLSLAPTETTAQACSPRPPVQLTVVPSGSTGFTVNVTAGAGAITALHFVGPTTNVPGAPNYQIQISDQQRA